MIKKTKAQSHIEVMFSLILFVGALIFIFIFINPFSEADKKVSVIDNEGNTILAFGTYGNRDSMGGLEGDLVPVKGIPMIWPNSVDATDDYMYVSDIVNIRVMRFEKTFALEQISK